MSFLHNLGQGNEFSYIFFLIIILPRQYLSKLSFVFKVNISPDRWWIHNKRANDKLFKQCFIIWHIWIFDTRTLDWHKNAIFCTGMIIRHSVHNLYSFGLRKPKPKAQKSYRDKNCSVLFSSLSTLLSFQIFILFSTCTGPISTKHGTRHLW